ncbi:hypothetical protein NHH03_06910 [Stieleria sp. TO1_6]|uniref:hypothetical protein n=1 Tax=Stieleria tagensis TaxID=2956795 RepID=UPI00209B9300|nr:hypothetical protein [Stieleria tagensis]MCO8121461.1 hypothetical protein [Stieleria tagensis]
MLHKLQTQDRLKMCAMAHISHLIDAAEVSENVQDIAQIQTGTQAFEVAKAPSEKQAEVVNRATEIANERNERCQAAFDDGR